MKSRKLLIRKLLVRFTITVLIITTGCAVEPESNTTDAPSRPPAAPTAKVQNILWALDRSSWPITNPRLDVAPTTESLAAHIQATVNGPDYWIRAGVFLEQTTVQSNTPIIVRLYNGSKGRACHGVSEWVSCAITGRNHCEIWLNYEADLPSNYRTLPADEVELNYTELHIVAMIHELGHCFGLPHSDGIMSDVTDPATVISDPHHLRPSEEMIKRVRQRKQLIDP